MCVYVIKENEEDTQLRFQKSLVLVENVMKKKINLYYTRKLFYLFRGFHSLHCR